MYAQHQELLTEHIERLTTCDMKWLYVLFNDDLEYEIVCTKCHWLSIHTHTHTLVWVSEKGSLGRVIFIIVTENTKKILKFK